MTEFRCKKCNRLLARFNECLELEIKCARCGMHNHLLYSGTQVRHMVFSSSASLGQLNKPKVVPLRAPLG